MLNIELHLLLSHVFNHSVNMDWTKEEIILIVSDYFDMLTDEQNGIPYNKSAHRKKLGPLLYNRDNAIEFKHQNISGILADMGLPYIKGYKPLFNYQRGILIEEVTQVLKARRSVFEKVFQKFADEKTNPSTKKVHFETMIDTSPNKKKHIEKEPLFLPIKINYLKREQNNRSLGEYGEQLVFDYEKWRLIKVGKEKLAESIEWVSKEKGDGLGYDILSKNNNGTDRFIEVKTTKLAKETPFYFSRTEWKFALSKDKDFFLYRVFNFNEMPKIFIKRGNYESFCNIIATTFKGVF